GLLALRDEIGTRNLNLVSLRDSLDLATPAGRLMFGIIASVAEYETEVRRERQIAGIAAAKEKGRRIGGRSTGVMNKRTRDRAAAVLALRSAGQGITEIARTTGLSRPTIYQLIG